jgi:flagellar motor switch protein FliG
MERNLATLNKVKNLDDHQIQNWLRRVGEGGAVELGVAMVGADPDVRDRIYRNMSKRAAGVLRDDLERFERSPLDDQTIIGYAVELEKLIDRFS